MNDKKKRIFALLVDKADEIKARTADALGLKMDDPKFKLRDIAPVQDADVDLLIHFNGTPTDAQDGIDQANEARKIIEKELGFGLTFVEMVPHPTFNIESKQIQMNTVIAWFKC